MAKIIDINTFTYDDTDTLRLLIIHQINEIHFLAVI